MEFADFLKLAFDTTGLVTLVSLSHGVAVQAMFHRKHIALHAQGLREFIESVLDGSRVPKNLHLFIAESRKMANTFVLATRDDLADALGTDPDDVETALFILSMKRAAVARQRKRAGSRRVHGRKSALETAIVRRQTSPHPAARPRSDEPSTGAGASVRASRGAIRTATKAVPGAASAQAQAQAQARLDSATLQVMPRVKALLEVEHKDTIYTQPVYYNLTTDMVEALACPRCALRQEVLFGLPGKRRPLRLQAGGSRVSGAPLTEEHSAQLLCQRPVNILATFRISRAENAAKSLVRRHVRASSLGHPCHVDGFSRGESE